MIRTIFQCKLCFAVGPILLLVFVFGCGTGEYESRLGGAAQQLEQGSAFAGMKPGAPLTGTTVKYKIPDDFLSQPLAAGVQDAPKRLQPAKLTLPGLQVTHEEFVPDSAGGKMSYYCYVAVIDMTKQGNRDPMDMFRRQAAGAFPEASGVPLGSIRCATPQGQTVDWRKFRFAAEQEFYYVDQNSKADFRTMPGVMEIYGRQEGDTLILIGWRVPTDPSGVSYVEKLDTWTMQVAGSVTAQ